MQEESSQDTLPYQGWKVVVVMTYQVVQLGVFRRVVEVVLSVVIYFPRIITNKTLLVVWIDK